MKEIEEVLWSERTREEILAWAERDGVVVVPIGSIEQHGLALPLDTDCRTVEYVARRTARLVDDVAVLVTPTIPFGVSPHHVAYPGTITLTVETVVRLLGEVCESIVAHGFDRILILSGHGGNEGTIGAAALELRHRLGRQIEARCWFDFIPGVIDAVSEGPVSTIGHAGEAEASAILALSPEAVRGGKMMVVDGITDDPSIASAEKGRRILDAGAETVAEFVRELAARPGRQVVGVRTVTEETS